MGACGTSAACRTRGTTRSASGGRLDPGSLEAQAYEDARGWRPPWQGRDILCRHPEPAASASRSFGVCSRSTGRFRSRCLARLLDSALHQTGSRRHAPGGRRLALRVWCPHWVEASDAGAHIVEGCVELGHVDVGVVQGAVAAVGEQVAQRGDARRVWLVRVLNQRGDLEQFGARRGCPARRESSRAARPDARFATRSGVSLRPVGRLHRPDDAQAGPHDDPGSRRTAALIGLETARLARHQS
jgi:hypothetical protein